ncbi:MAG TPA: hypothetical protein VMW20_07220, partial [Candidatus Nanoarchaeia archaeon]|nr:hypothetical protein [Candidatus Nanoarchaeia archaeon]
GLYRRSRYGPYIKENQNEKLVQHQNKETTHYCVGMGSGFLSSWTSGIGIHSTVAHAFDVLSRV